MQTTRIVELPAGVAFVVTDLHSAWAPYQQLRDAFLALHARGEADVFVCCGDLIHAREPDEPDRSLDMLRDVMRLQRELGSERVVMLLGNHELPHIYTFTLAKGEVVYTPPFERALAALGGARADVIDWLIGLPFYASTQAGVLFSHAGTSPVLTNAAAVRDMLTFEHRALLNDAQALLDANDKTALVAEYEHIARRSYAQWVRDDFAVMHTGDPRYLDALRGLIIMQGDARFQLLWDALFSQNERECGQTGYDKAVRLFLGEVSAYTAQAQRVLVAGHIAARGGYTLVGEQQLRLASFAHAKPAASGRYLLLDTTQRVERAGDLVERLRPTFG